MGATPVQDEFFDTLLADFLDESSQLLDRLNENLLELDEWAATLDEPGRCDDDLMNEMFRAAHSIKGLSAMLGLQNINSLTHKLENVFDAARKDELLLDRNVVEVAFGSVDLLVAMMDQLKTDGNDEVDASENLKEIGELLQTAGCEREQTSQADAEKALTDDGADAPSADETASPSAEPTMSNETPSTPAPPVPLTDHFTGIVDESGVPAKYLSIFIDETFESLDSLSETLLSDDVETNTAATETLLITSHRIKGSAASVGLNRPAKLAHLMEDILQELREAGDTVTAEMTDAMLKCTDALRNYVTTLKAGDAQSDGFNELAHGLLVAKDPQSQAASQTAAAGEAAGAGGSAEESAAGPVDYIAAVKNETNFDGPAVAVRVFFEADLPLVGLKARLVYEKLAHAGNVYWCDSPIDGLDDLENLASLMFGLAGEHDLDQLRAKLNVSGVDRVELSALAQEGQQATVAPPTPTPPPAEAKPAPAPAAAAAPPPPPAQPKPAPTAPKQRAAASAETRKTRPPETTSKPNETLRVDIERLDQLMNLAGQLVINKARFSQIGDGLKGSLLSKQTPQLISNAAGMASKLLSVTESSDAQRDLETIRSHARRLQADLEIVDREIGRLTQVRNGVSELFEAVHQLDRVADGIQQSVMDTRMVPIGPLFGRFKRVVRDITRNNGNDIRLTIRGEKTELDKRMIDELGDPLIHMVRNSADHGIESPEVREAAGKSRQGEVTLDAFHRGNSIYIQVKDDGKGLDRDRILNKAIEKNIISAADTEKMSTHQIYQLIWEPGFSTAAAVTEISGRGMGMDIVRSKIDDLNGTVEVDSTPGEGTTFTIKLPLTLAILPSLMAKIDGDVFALPVESVVEIVSIPVSEMSTVHSLSTATIRGRIVSVVDLNEVFTWNRYPESTGTGRGTAEKTIVVIGREGNELGLLVDDLLGEENVVIKSMAENYQNVPGIAGASILGDGRVSLILDINAIIEMSSEPSSSSHTAKEKKACLT